MRRTILMFSVVWFIFILQSFEAQAFGGLCKHANVGKEAINSYGSLGYEELMNLADQHGNAAYDCSEKMWEKVRGIYFTLKENRVELTDVGKYIKKGLLKDMGLLGKNFLGFELSLIGAARVSGIVKDRFEYQKGSESTFNAHYDQIAKRMLGINIYENIGAIYMYSNSILDLYQDQDVGDTVLSKLSQLSNKLKTYCDGARERFAQFYRVDIEESSPISEKLMEELELAIESGWVESTIEQLLPDDWYIRGK